MRGELMPPPRPKPNWVMFPSKGMPLSLSRGRSPPNPIRTKLAVERGKSFWFPVLC